jgi:hypothetical protein
MQTEVQATRTFTGLVLCKDAYTKYNVSRLVEWMDSTYK